VAAVVVGGAMLYFLSRNPHPGPLPGDRREHNLPLANYVGSERCISCHTEEAAQWQKSQHHAAMVPANAESVHGDFNNAKFNYTEITSTFFKRNGKFFVNTDGPEGKLADYEVKYTFGVSPLQQYLIGFPDGRLQALSIAWDSRPKKEGGQRWFHLYPNERITYDDELHWTRPSQNWNFMCADCHSTFQLTGPCPTLLQRACGIRVLWSGLERLQSLANAPLDARLSLVASLLADPVRAVRIEAVSLLAAIPPGQLTPEQRAAFERAASEFVETQRYNADRAEARVTLGTFYGNRGDAARAEEEIKAAIRLEPFFIPAYVNLADLYRAIGRDADGERILREGLKIAPKSPILHHALGLALCG
jgi:hypothetical protein